MAGDEDKAVVPINADTIRDRIVNRIKDQFIELIPDEAFKSLVEGEIKSFTEDVDKKDRWGNATHRQSPLKDIIQSVLKEKFEKQVRSLLDSPEYQAYFDDVNQPGEAIKQIVREVAPDMWMKLVTSSVCQAVQNIRAQGGF